eukprot:3526506-Pyramimonas_sp.AAC.1
MAACGAPPAFSVLRRPRDARCIAGVLPLPPQHRLQCRCPGRCRPRGAAPLSASARLACRPRSPP